MERFFRFVVCACGAAVIAGGLWWLMATNIIPIGGYDQAPPKKPSEIEFIDPSQPRRR